MRAALDARLTLYDSAGVGRYIRHLASALAGQLGPGEFKVLADFRDGGWGRDAIGVIGPAHSGLGDRLLSLQLRAMDLDVLHSPDHVLPPAIPCPSVLTVHDVSFLALAADEGGAPDGYYARCRESLERAEAVICDSEFTKCELLRLTGVEAAKLKVIDPGLSPHFGPHAARRSAPVAAKYGLRRPYVLSVGTAGPRKNVGRLVRAFLQTPHARRTTLALAGRGSIEFLEAMELGSERVDAASVTALGAPSQEDMPALIAGAECVALVSLYEGFGMPLLEAMGSGVPCLASNRRPFTDFAQGAAEFVDPSDEADIARGLDRLLSDEGRREMLGAQGLRLARAFTWERAAAATAALYRTVAG